MKDGNVLANALARLAAAGKRALAQAAVLPALALLPPAPVQALSLPDKPLLAPGAGVLPNVIVTFDNSDAGARGSSDGGGVGSGAKRYHFSAAYNTYYYDPYKRYVSPPGYPQQEFTSACFFLDSPCDKGRKNLSTEFLATAQYVVSTPYYAAMWHPARDSTWSGCTGFCPFGSREVGAPAYYYWRDNSLPDCTASDLQDEDCYRYVKVGSSEDQALCAAKWGASSSQCTEAALKQNFANWYSYYRTAHLAYITAALRAFPKLEGKVRLAWQGHGMPNEPMQCAGFGGEIPGDTRWHNTCSFTAAGGAKTYDNRLKEYTGGHVTDFHDWLRYVTYAGNPPNTARAATIRAAEYFMRDNAYRDDPRSSTSPVRSCRQNFHVMFNGPFYSNRDVEGGWMESRIADRYRCGGVSGHSAMCSAHPKPTSEQLPSPTGWVPMAPFRMNPGNDDKRGWDEFSPGGLAASDGSSLANLAFHFWVRDLKDGAAFKNDVPPYFAEKSGDFENDFWNPKNDLATWQHMVNFFVVNTTLDNLDDGGAHGDGHDFAEGMYGGPIVGAKTKGWPATLPGLPKGVTYDFWHAAINSRGLFIPATDVEAMVAALTATFDEVLKRGASSSALASSISSTESIAGTHIYKAAFYANDWSGSLAAYALDADGAPAETPEWEAGFPSWSARNLVFWTGSGAAVFAYGALTDAQKADFDAAAGGLDKTAVANWIRGDRSQEGITLRKRERLLGDIVNSDPVYVGDENYPLNSRLAGTEGSQYRKFVGDKKDRPKMVYVGANDGMVHGFVAGAGAGGNICGASGLGQEVFAYIPGAVVGKLPYLAKPDYSHRFYADGSLFAGDAYLNLGDGDKWRTILVGGLGNGGRAVFALDVTDPCAFGPGKVLWEFSSGQDADLGYTHARPLTAKLNNGQWAAIVANGYNSANGHAVLFLLDLKTGALIRKIDADADAGAGSLDNGLMSPTLYDANGDGKVDYVYAGDNLGRLWKFDLSSSNPAEWRVAFGGQPLFSTGGEPIQAAPRLGDPPSGTDGVMVYFGSGRLAAEADISDSGGRGLYGVLDSGTGNLARANLQAQAVTEEVTAADRTIRKATRNAVDYTTQRGWYLPLSGGERVTVPAQFVSGRVIFTAVNPSADPCGVGGDTWLYELDPSTGAMPEKSIFELGTSVELAALKLKGLHKAAIFLRDYGAGKGVMLSQSITGQTNKAGVSLSGLRMGRVSWREVID